MSQDSLFALGAVPAHQAPRAADSTRRGPSCWDYCGHLAITEHRHLGTKVTKHPFRMCHRVQDDPVPVFEHECICDEALERVPKWAPAESVMPETSGWEDY